MRTDVVAEHSCGQRRDWRQGPIRKPNPAAKRAGTAFGVAAWRMVIFTMFAETMAQPAMKKIAESQAGRVIGFPPTNGTVAIAPAPTT